MPSSLVPNGADHEARLYGCILHSPVGAINPCLAAAETQLRGVEARQFPIEEEPAPQLGLRPPPASYPLSPVDQKAQRGIRHGFVNTTLGNLAFRVPALRLPGRLPIELGLTYDSAISESMPFPPPPYDPGDYAEPRADIDLGKNWILGYSDYIVETRVKNLFLMAPQNGDLIHWQQQAGGGFVQCHATPSVHLTLTRVNPSTLVERRLDGTLWTYSVTGMTSTNGLPTYGVVQIADRSGHTINISYQQGCVSRIENSDGAWVEFRRPLWDPENPGEIFPMVRVTQIVDSTGRQLSLDYDENGRLTSFTDALGNTWTYTYAVNDKLASAIDPLGNTYFTASYNGANRVLGFPRFRGHHLKGG